MIYLDNAATSYPKPRSVLREFRFCLKKCVGNPGRSGHFQSIAAAEKIYEAREIIAAHIGAGKPENIVFTYNATYALNMAIRAKIKPYSHVLISDMEHNAVIRPLELLKNEMGIEYTSFDSSGDIRKNILQKVRSDTSVLISTLQSNVTGRKIPLEILSNVAYELGLTLIVDASQSAGHDEIDLQKTPCHALCAPGHKGLFGFTGSGFVCFSDSGDISPFITGGSGSESKNPNMPMLLPERLEAGTLSAPTVASLAAGVKFVNSVGLSEIKKKEEKLSQRLISGLGEIKRVKIYESFGSIVLFNVGDIPEAHICSELDRVGVCVRGGLHCAPSAHKLLGTVDKGAVRVSLSYFNNQNEIDEFIKYVKNIAAEL